MKPGHIKEIREKEVRRIHKRSREIWKEQKALGYIELKTPIRHGWFKEIVITTKISRYKNEKAIHEIYEVIEKVFWGRDKTKAEEKWQQQTSNYFIYKDFPTITKKQFNRLSYKAQLLCTAYRFKNKCNKWKTRFYIRIPKNAYKIKFTRAYITHLKRIDPKLESEDALLDQQFLKPGYYKIAQKRWSWRHRHYWNRLEYKKEKQKTKVNLKAISIEDIIKENINKNSAKYFF